MTLTLSPFAQKRLKRIEQANRARARRMGCNAVPVDFIAVLEAQAWACAITGDPLDPDLAPPHGDSISLEHRNPLSNGGAHDAGNVCGVKLAENLKKGRTQDTPRAAKAKRQAAKFARPVIGRSWDDEEDDLDEAPARPRRFDDKPAKLKTRQKRKIRGGGFQTNKDGLWKAKIGGGVERRK